VIRDRLAAYREAYPLTEGPIGPPLVLLALPIVITNLLQTAYNLADTFWLGRYSTDALAAISFAFPLIFLLIALGLGIAVAGAILIAQATGAEDPDLAAYTASQTMSYALIASVGFGVIGYVGVGPLIALFGATPAVVTLATAYMQIIAIGLPVMFGFFVFIALMRGYGDTITPMVVMFGTVVLNIAIDPLFIFGFIDNPLFTATATTEVGEWLYGRWAFDGLGIEGAAIATVLSRGLAFVVGVWVLASGRAGIEIRLRAMWPDPTFLRRLLRLGVPATIEETGTALSINAMLFIVGLFPTTVIAAYGIGIRIFSIVFLPAIGVARGVETMTGQSLGAGVEDRADAAAAYAARWGFLILSGFAVVTFIFAEAIVGIFTTDPAVIEAGRSFLYYVAPSFGFVGIARAYIGSFRGAGKTAIAAVLGIVILGVVRLPIAVVGAFSIGADGVWAAFTISNVLGALFAVLWYRSGRWSPDVAVRPRTDQPE
jgi:putative efflux protein, MATE family